MSRSIEELEALIRHHKELYYSGQTEITDHDYDKLEEELEKLDPENAVLKMVGSANLGGEKVKHDQKMLSLNKTYKIEDLITWIDQHEVVSTYKIDGVSCSLVYDKGALSIAKTRGDGVQGENITQKILWIQTVPSRIKEELKIEVRGEIYCDDENFFHLGQEMEKRGLERPSNQRNIVAGLMGRKDNIDLCKFLNFKAFEVITESHMFKTEIQKHDFLLKEKFDVNEIELHKKNKALKKELQRRIDETQEFMIEGDYLIDGLVFSFNDLSLHEELGSTSHHPRYKMAFKFQGETKEAVIEKITWQVSRNGILTPVAQIKPVELSGAKISRVTLHNYGVIKQHHLKAGDKIEIVRSGEVIPKFLQVIYSQEGDYEKPDLCPECESKVIEEEIRLFCSNTECPARIKETIINFVRKIGIDDLSTKRLEEMMRKELVRSIEDLYELEIEDFYKLDKVKEKLANKLYNSIQKSKDVELTTFLSSLGIQGGALNKCEKVVQAGFNSIDKILDLTVSDLIEVESFGEKSATEFIQSLNQKKPLIKKLLKRGFSFTIVEVKDSPVTQKKICITGTLSRKRADIEKDIRDYGGIVVSSVSKNTDFLLTNDTDPTSSKFKKALELGVSIISEDDFSKMIKE